MNKFNAKKITIDGIIFDSKKEAAFYHRLCLLKNAKNINDRVLSIDLQPRFDIIINLKRIGFYKADFRVLYADNTVKVYDVKGCKVGAAYQLFRFKKKIIEALYNIEIIEV